MNTRRINIVLSFFVAVLLVFSGIAPFCSAVLPQAEVAFAATSDVDAYYESIDTSLTGDSFRNNLATLITQTHKILAICKPKKCPICKLSAVGSIPK